MTRTATTALVAEAKTTADACESGIAIGRCRSARSSAQHSSSQLRACRCQARFDSYVPRARLCVAPVDTVTARSPSNGSRVGVVSRDTPSP